jgi:prophage maintenance system killer protein
MALSQQEYRVEPQQEAKVQVRVHWAKVPQSDAMRGNAGEISYTLGDGARRAVREYGADLDRLADS